MRWATFDRKMKQIEAAEAVCDAHLFWFVQKLSQFWNWRLPRMWLS
jgi:hypothetical protein